MRREDLRPLSVFDGLKDDQLDQLLEGGTEVRIQPGVDLFRAGEHADFWWVLVDGAVDLIRHVGREDVVVAKMDVPGRWAGGFRAWDDEGVYLATGRGVTGGRVLRVPADVLRARANSWFPFGGRLIEGLYHTARSIESTTRQRESLVALGTLSAGLAHEINNPASAAARAVAALQNETQTLLGSLGQLARNEITAGQLADLDALRHEIEGRAVEADPLARGDREQAVAAWLDRQGVVDVWSIAPSLSAAGVDVDWCERAAAVLDQRALEPGLHWVASAASVGTLLGELKDSTRRISRLVADVSSYSQMDRASMQHIDLRDGVESTLVMLGHKLSAGVTVVRDYADDLPGIDAFAGELNQVWTNLIDNALAAMDGHGVLTVAARLVDGDVVVEIADTGPGMPPDVAQRAFEAFFTTKDPGQGTGLGLDIARRIVVQRHGGTIEIDSQPGHTVLRVRLPVRPSQTTGASQA
ncbi:MAG: ATP-binding protein [Candidatus Nanopelagicales bacterium]